MDKNKAKTRAMRLVAPVIALTLVFSACSAKTDDKAKADESTTTVSEATTTAPEDNSPGRLVPAEGIELDQEAQYAGWLFEFGTLSSDEGDMGDDDGEAITGMPTTLEVALKYTNLPSESATPNVPINLEVEDTDDDTVENISVSDSDFSEVPGGGTGKGSITFQLDDEQAELFSLDTATIVLGGDSNVEARIPLSDSGDLVSLKPQEQKPGFEDFTMGDWEFTAESTELRWDGIVDHSAAESGQTWLAFTFDVEAGAGDGQLWPKDWKWAVTTPDGTSLTGDDIVMSDGKNLEYQENGTTVKGYVFWFTLETPVDGEYEFTLTGPFGPDKEEVSKTMKVELKAADSADAPDDASSDDDSSATTTTTDEEDED